MPEWTPGGYVQAMFTVIAVSIALFQIAGLLVMLDSFQKAPLAVEDEQGFHS